MSSSDDAAAGPLARLGKAPSTVLADPWGMALLGLVLAQIAVWTALPYALAASLPLDVVSDGVAWGHEWQWGYFKHPPLPSWEAEIFFRLLGDLGPFLLSQLSIAATYVFVFLLGRKMMAPDRALVATVLLTGIFYFSVPTPEFNHNIAQMPLWAAAAYFYYDALQTRRFRAWLLLGLALGLGMISKYEIAILGLAIVLHAAGGRSTRAVFAATGPYLALLACLAVMSAHLVWLVQNDFPTLRYAQARASDLTLLGRLLVPLHFLVTQLLDVAVALIVAVFIGLLRRDSLRGLTDLRDENMRFLLYLGLGPVLICVVLSLATGMGLRDMWGAPMWNLTGLILVVLGARRWDRISFRRLFRATVALFILLPLAYALASTYVPRWQGRHARTQWPDRAMAQRFSGLWQGETGSPLRIVAGDGWLAGLIAMRSTPRLSVFTDGDVRKAPWITPQRLSREGTLVVWQQTKKPPPVLKLPGLRIMGVQTFAWPDNRAAAPLSIGWGIVRPVQTPRHGAGP